MKLPHISHKKFDAMIEQLALTTGWKPYHTYDSRRSDKGFPDWILIKENNTGKQRRKNELIAAELKVGKDKPTPDQLLWLQAFAAVPGCHSYIWRIEDWDKIAALLQGKSGKEPTDAH